MCHNIIPVVKQSQYIYNVVKKKETSFKLISTCNLINGLNKHLFSLTFWLKQDGKGLKCSFAVFSLWINNISLCIVYIAQIKNYSIFFIILDIWKTIKSIPCPVFQNQTFLPLLKFRRCKYHEAIIFQLNLKVAQNARPFFEFPAAVFFYSISLSLS